MKWHSLFSIILANIHSSNEVQKTYSQHETVDIRLKTDPRRTAKSKREKKGNPK